MPAQFLDQLADSARQKQADLRRVFKTDADADERAWKKLTQRHWHPLPDRLPTPPDAVLYGVDGSRGVLPLANGARIAVIQALSRSTSGAEERRAELEVIDGSVPGDRVRRFIDLRLRQVETELAAQVAAQAPEGSIIFVDGGLYAPLTFLVDFDWPVRRRGRPSPLPRQIAASYVRLFDLCWDCRITLIGLSKTSRDPLHAELWSYSEGRESAGPPSVAEALYRWTGGQPGYSTPFILGYYGFTGRSEPLLERPEFKQMPAIVSFYVRFRPHDPPLRVETPVPCLGLRQKLVELDWGAVETDNPGLTSLFARLKTEYVSRDMYNALLWAVDQQVRLSRPELVERYRRIIEREAGVELDLDRSARRFVSRQSGNQEIRELGNQGTRAAAVT
jgi:hypothetical protein